MKKLINIFSLVAIASMVLLNSCNKNEILDPAKGEQSFEEKTLESLSGTVVDENNLPLAGVTVNAHGQTYTTTTTGFFIFYNLTVPNNRYVIKFSRQNYFSVTRSEAVVTGSPGQMKVSLMPIQSTATTEVTNFDASAGGQIAIGNIFNFTFPADNFIYESGSPYTGNVNVAVLYMDPTDPNYHLRVHGGDQRGIIEGNNQEYLLRAFVGANIMLYDDSGQKLQLDPNMPPDVDFEIELPPGLENLCPADIDIWTFNNVFGLRNTTGSQAHKEGTKVVGRVGHFSYISCEISYNTSATVMGHVTNANGDAIPGITVKIGESYAITNQDGFYSREVIAGVPVDVEIPNYLGTAYGPYPVTPYGNTTIDIVVTPASVELVYGSLVDCNGNLIAGNIVVSWAGENVAIYTTTGYFSIEVTTGTFNVDIYAFGNGVEKYLSMVNVNVPVEIVLCPPIPTGPNYLTINGDPINAQLTGFTIKEGVYDNSFTETVIECSGQSGDYYIYFSGNSAGTFPMISAGIQYMGPPTWSDSFDIGSITVASYGNVGELIEGTFSGITLDGTLIENGHFSVVRQHDQ